jgi:hypothetical protein
MLVIASRRPEAAATCLRVASLHVLRVLATATPTLAASRVPEKRSEKILKVHSRRIHEQEATCFGKRGLLDVFKLSTCEVIQR